MQGPRAALLVITLACHTATARQAATDPPPPPPSAAPAPSDAGQPPSITAPAHVAHPWTSGGGLRCEWAIPPDLKPGDKRDLVVILHGSGQDRRWGLREHPPGTFRPREFLLSPDGTSAGLEGARLFQAREKDMDLLASTLAEIKALLPVERVFLYGYGQGGSFALYFAAVHHELVAGVVAHGCGAGGGLDAEALLGTPIVFLHAARDAGVPYERVTRAHDRLLEMGHEMVQVRRLPGAGGAASPRQTSECVDWCAGMLSRDPADVLARARTILTAAPGETVPVWFSGGHDLLTRIIGRHVRSLVPAAPDLEGQRALARPLLEAVETHASLHVVVLRGQVRTAADLILTGDSWLGHLVPLREDFRGVRPIEQYVTVMGYDEAAEAHRAAAVELTQSWYRRAGARETFETIVRVLPHCFLAEGLPPGMEEQVPEWFKEAPALGLSPDAMRGYRHFLMWRTGWEEGRKQYEGLWREWALP